MAGLTAGTALARRLPGRVPVGEAQRNRHAGRGAPVDLRCDRSETATSSAALGNPGDTEGSSSTLSCSNSALQV